MKKGIRDAGGTPMEFNTVSISDGITMGSEGMRASLVSREVIADSIELVARGNLFRRHGRARRLRQDDSGRRSWRWRALDIPGADALRRIDRAGTVSTARDVTIQDVFEAVGAHARRQDERRRVCSRSKSSACPGAGACGGQFTANTMAMVCEFLGISPMGSASVPAVAEDKAEVAREAGRTGHGVARAGLRPRDSHHPRGDRERDRQRRRIGRLDQRRAASARDRARSGLSSLRSTTSTASVARRR